ncbi:MAG: hypothetical protein ACRC33_02615, partial [Gemmataceae bacterium]
LHHHELGLTAMNDSAATATLEPMGVSEPRAMLTLVSSFAQMLTVARAVRPEAVRDGETFTRSLDPALVALVRGGPGFADRVLREWVTFCGEVARGTARPDRYSDNYWRGALAETVQVMRMLGKMAPDENEATREQLSDRLVRLDVILDDIDSAGFAAAAHRWRDFNVEGRPSSAPESYFAPTAEPKFTMAEFAGGAGQFTPSGAMLDEDWSAAARAAREKGG